MAATSIAPSIPPEPRSILCFRGCAMPLRLNAYSARRWRIRRIDSPESSIRDQARRSTGRNILEQDHRAIKRRMKAKQGLREFDAARRTIQGYKAMHMIRKGQARWVSGSDVRQQIQFINQLFDVGRMRLSLIDPTIRSLAVF